MASNNAVSLVSTEEQEKISRKLLAWLNQYPDKPVTVINYEYLTDDAVSMALSTIQAAYKTAKYITGGYQAQYQFKVIYRSQPSGNDQRLKMDELLNAIGDWASARTDLPDFGTGIQCLKIEATTRSSLFARYENGDEDHQILMNMNYEVI